MKLLLGREDVNSNLPDNRGQTPLSLASQNRHKRVVELLKAHQSANSLQLSPNNPNPSPQSSKTSMHRFPGTPVNTPIHTTSFPFSRPLSPPSLESAPASWTPLSPLHFSSLSHGFLIPPEYSSAPDIDILFLLLYRESSPHLLVFIPFLANLSALWFRLIPISHSFILTLIYSTFPPTIPLFQPSMYRSNLLRKFLYPIRCYSR